ncbi:MAG TPA: tRNA (adenosine(37)-N6)-dimethylallyltransferase MiaA [Aquiluna sp.]
MPFSVLAVVGPTASGKSSLALAIAKSLGNIEIINADAMQLYRGMDIGTAKLSFDEREGVPHHLIDVVSPEQDLTAVEYAKLAHEKISEVIERGNQPVLVGGSMFYVAAALDEMDFAPTDEAVRERLESEAEEIGAMSMHDRLNELDPASANRIPAQNVRRVVRALEVIELTGEPYKSSLPEPRYLRPTLQLGISVDREVLKQRIRDRVLAMWESGLLDEVRGLQRSGLTLSRTAAVAIGYAQAASQLAGELSEKEAIEQTITLTNRYARRQMSWFRRDSRIQWLDSSKNLEQQAIEQIRLGR